MKIAFAALSLPATGAVAVPVAYDCKLLASASKLDKATKGALGRAMAVSRFTGKKNELLEVLAPPGLKNSRVVLVGIGNSKGLTDLDLEDLGGTLLGHLNSVGETRGALVIESSGRAKAGGGARAAHAGYGALLRSYRFDRYRTKEKPEKKPTLKNLDILVDDLKTAKQVFGRLEKVASGVFSTRDLVSEPANVIFPKSLAAKGRELQKLGVKVQVLGEAAMAKLGMGSLLGVGQGSARESQLLVMQWDGAGKTRAKAPVAFVGKGVTFDTGGISIKPAGGMEDMKWDMGGAGVVIGLMKALAARKAKVNAVGVCGLVENMPSASAQRPGDIVTSMSGQTIEVINTDAEGRLVLADALWYTQQKFKPRAIVDLATLTGAIIVALGHDHAGLFSNDDAHAESLLAAGKAVGEKLWPMPVDAAYDKQLDCDIADMKNIGAGRGAGSVTAAKFLERFVNKVPWAHLDIAGVTWSKKESALVPKGGTAFGVRLLDRLVADCYEAK